MRNQAIEFKKIRKELPKIGIMFCGDRAVVSARGTDIAPYFHQDVQYGPLFKIRLGMACMSVFKNMVKKTLNN